MNKEQTKEKCEKCKTDWDSKNCSCSCHSPSPKEEWGYAHQVCKKCGFDQKTHKAWGNKCPKIGFGHKKVSSPTLEENCPHGANENECPVINCANSKLPHNDWEEGMEKQAKRLSECADVMPESLAKHQNRIYNACLDMIYSFKNDVIPAVRKEEREKVAKFIDENRHKVERIDRYVLTDLLNFLSQSEE